MLNQRGQQIQLNKSIFWFIKFQLSFRLVSFELKVIVLKSIDFLQFFSVNRDLKDALYSHSI